MWQSIDSIMFARKVSEIIGLGFTVGLPARYLLCSAEFICFLVFRALGTRQAEGDGDARRQSIMGAPKGVVMGWQEV